MISPNTCIPISNAHAVQYGVWPDCCNNCDFCLRLNRKTTNHSKKIWLINRVRENIKYIDWKNKFSHGISLLGGELFYIKNQEVQDAFMKLIDDIVEIILIPGNENTKFSTVTNGIYNPEFLYKAIDRIVEKVGIQRVDVNFSYDLKYRYHNEAARLKAFNNINAFHKRYNYKVGIQMILTQYVIDLWKKGEFEPTKFIEDNFPGNTLAFLYPHPIHTGIKLPDFNFKRKDFLVFLKYLRDTNYEIYLNFINSTKNSGTFKYTGLRDKRKHQPKDQVPILSDGKEELAECGHSMLYRCYADSDKCILCDLKLIDNDL